MYIVKLRIARIDFLVNSEIPGREVLSALGKAEKKLGFPFKDVYLSPSKVSLAHMNLLEESWNEIDSPCYLIEDSCKNVELELGYGELYSTDELVLVLKAYVTVGIGRAFDFYEHVQDIPKNYLVEL